MLFLAEKQFSGEKAFVKSLYRFKFTYCLYFNWLVFSSGKIIVGLKFFASSGVIQA